MDLVSKTQYIVWQQLLGEFAMTRAKDETLSFRTSKNIKQLLKAAADKEHRSQASMIEVLILDYAKKHGLQRPEGGV